MVKTELVSRREIVGAAVLVSAALSQTSPAQAQAATDEVQIEATALDYIQGWYAGDAARMERALHPELAKRIVVRAAGQKDKLEQQSAMTLLLKTRAAIGRGDANPRGDVKLLDRFGDAAVVRVDASSWVDYLSVAKWEDCECAVGAARRCRPGGAVEESKR